MKPAKISGCRQVLPLFPPLSLEALTYENGSPEVNLETSLLQALSKICFAMRDDYLLASINVSLLQTLLYGLSHTRPECSRDARWNWGRGIFLRLPHHALQIQVCK